MDPLENPVDRDSGESGDNVIVVRKEVMENPR